MGRDEDAALVGRCARGDAQALQRLHELHAPGLLRFLERLLGDADRAEDVCQEAFLRMWRKADLFDPVRGSFTAWLYRAAANLAYNRLSLRSSKETILETADDLRAAEKGHPVSGAIESEHRELVRSALGRLAPADQAILTLRHLEERPVAEVAELLGIPEGTVKSRCFYALRRLQGLLEGQLGPSAESSGEDFP